MVLTNIGASSKPTSTIPIRCLERRPNSQTVWFAGQPINVAAIAESFEPPLGYSHLTKIFKGTRQPSVDVARQIALALGMSLGAFLEALEHN